MDYSVIDRLEGRPGICVLRDEPMAGHTTFRIGGPADRFVTVSDETALAQVLSAVKEAGLPRFLLGNGSNLLVADAGYRGVVIALGGDFKQIEPEEDGRTLRCGAGASLASLCKAARDYGLSGLEFAWGIPGSAGGAVYMNAGAYGGEMKDVLVSATAVSGQGEKRNYSGEELALSYRHSVFSGGESIITSLRVRLSPAPVEDIQRRMNELLSRRREKQPLEFPSAGSTFKRPEGYFAAALIEQCGLKGYTIGGAQVSLKHSGFLINTGQATCREMIALIEHVRYVVEEWTGVRLETEIEFLGM